MFVLFVLTLQVLTFGKGLPPLSEEKLAAIAKRKAKDQVVHSATKKVRADALDSPPSTSPSHHHVIPGHMPAGNKQEYRLRQNVIKEPRVLPPEPIHYQPPPQLKQPPPQQPPRMNNNTNSNFNAKNNQIANNNYSTNNAALGANQQSSVCSSLFALLLCLCFGFN
jgi:hypothetical protein